MIAIENVKINKVKGRGANRLISSALLGWEDEDYNKVNKKLIDYGYKYKEIVFKKNSTSRRKNEEDKKSFVVINRI